MYKWLNVNVIRHVRLWVDVEGKVNPEESLCSPEHYVKAKALCDIWLKADCLPKEQMKMPSPALAKLDAHIEIGDAGQDIKIDDTRNWNWW